MKILARMYASQSDRRGLGDTVQFNIVLRHIQHYFPDWEVHVETTAGKDTCHIGTGLCQKVYVLKEQPTPYEIFDKTLNFRFEEPGSQTSDWCLEYQVPASKPTHSIIRVLDKQPIKDFFHYQIHIDEYSRKRAKQYIESLPQKNGVVILHYQAISSPHNKNIEPKDAERICKTLLVNGYTPLILDWRGTSPLPDNRRIFCPNRSHPIWNGKNNGNAKMIAALIENARLFVGVDSGPLHIAGCTKTPALGYWKYHHPVHFYDFAENVTHLLPRDARKFIRSPHRIKIEDFFNAHYKHSYYGNRGDAVIDAICQELSIERNGPGSAQNNGKPTHIPYEDVTPIQPKQWWSIKLS